MYGAVRKSCRAVLTNDLKIDLEEVNGFKFCGVHRLGKQSRGRPRPIIARFTSRSDRDKVWKMRRNLKGSIVKIGEDLPKQVQDIRKNILTPAMKKARSMNPRNKASVIGDKSIVNRKQYLHFNIPKRWMNIESPRILARTRQKIKQKCQLMDQNTTAVSKRQTYY